MTSYFVGRAGGAIRGSQRRRGVFWRSWVRVTRIQDRVESQPSPVVQFDIYHNRLIHGMGRGSALAHVIKLIK